MHMALQSAPLTGQMVGNPRRADFACLYGVIQRTACCGGVHQQVRAVNQKVIQTLDTQAAQRIVNGAAQVVRAGIVVLDLAGTGGRVVVGNAGFGHHVEPLGQGRAGTQRLAE